jgi:hypothetical protein
VTAIAESDVEPRALKRDALMSGVQASDASIATYPATVGDALVNGGGQGHKHACEEGDEEGSDTGHSEHNYVQGMRLVKREMLSNKEGKCVATRE